MPRKRRKSRQKLGYHSGHVLQLCTGFDFFGDGFGNGDDAIKKMRRAWPILKSQVMEMWARRERAGRQPWGCRFDKKINA
jgi:hypothetical protein